MRGDLPGNKPSPSRKDWISVPFWDAGAPPLSSFNSQNTRIFRWRLDESMPLLWLRMPTVESAYNWFVYDPFFLRVAEYCSKKDILETFSRSYKQHSRIRFKDLEWVWVPSSQKEPPEGFEDAFLYQKGEDFVWISEKNMPQPRYYHKGKVRFPWTDCAVLEDVLLLIDSQDEIEALLKKHALNFLPITTEPVTVGLWWTTI